MQKKIFWIGLICSVLVLIGSCKKEESDSNATTASCTVSTTPAGSIALGSNNISGIYSSSWQEVVPSSGFMPTALHYLRGLTSLVEEIPLSIK